MQRLSAESAGVLAMRRPGHVLTSFLSEISSITWLAIHTFLDVIEHVARRHRFPFRRSIIFEQFDRVGPGSIPLVAMVSLFLGMTMALLTGYQLEPYGTENLVPALIAIAFTRELGPLLTGIVLAARIGAAYTAELGTMTVSEEVEAIESMGIGPFRFLVAPRVVAITLFLPCLAIVSTLSALLGAMIVSVTALSIASSYYWELAYEALLVRDIVSGLVKSAFFGLVIALIACYKGLAVEGGAAGVGEATTKSVVAAITTVIALDTVFNVILLQTT